MGISVARFFTCLIFTAECCFHSTFCRHLRRPPYKSHQTPPIILTHLPKLYVTNNSLPLQTETNPRKTNSTSMAKPVRFFSRWTEVAPALVVIPRRHSTSPRLETIAEDDSHQNSSQHQPVKEATSTS